MTAPGSNNTISPNSNDESSKTAPLSGACQKCARLLTEVLLENARKDGCVSRPHALLKAMGVGSIRETGAGVNVQFPSGSELPPTQQGWKETAEKTSSTTKAIENIPPIVGGAATLATSASSSATAMSTLQPSRGQPTTIKIECRPCSSTGPEGGARAFVMGPKPLSVVVCSNRLAGGGHDEMEEVLTHELTHVYDIRQLQLNLRECEQLAYSEVRAARQAECHNSWLQPFCVKQKAITATHNMFPRQGRQCIQRVFEKAMADTRPFPKSKSS